MWRQLLRNKRILFYTDEGYNDVISRLLIFTQTHAFTDVVSKIPTRFTYFTYRDVSCVF